MADCIFCNIVRDSTNESDTNPQAKIHVLIIPNMHLNSLAYIGPGQIPIMGHLFVVAEEMARREGIALSGYRTVLNQGSDSGQEIAHLHMHVIGGQPLAAIG
jgi:histidine triad (HIT) family protein